MGQNNNNCALNMYMYIPSGIGATVYINITRLKLTSCFLIWSRRCRIRSGQQSILRHIWYKPLVIGDYIASTIRLRQVVDKVNKENLKPRKNNGTKLRFIQCNMQKSHHAQIDLNRRLSIMNKKQEPFICFEYSVFAHKLDIILY